MIAPRQVGEKFAEFPHSSEYLRAARFKQSVGMPLSAMAASAKADHLHSGSPRGCDPVSSAEHMRVEELPEASDFQ